jgi:hypothetical protein
MNIPRLLTSRNDVVYDQHFLAGFDGIRLSLKDICAIFFRVAGIDCLARQLAAFPNRHEPGLKAKCQSGSNVETSCVEPDDDIGAARPAVLLADKIHQCVDKQGMQVRIRKEGRDVLEENAGRGKVGILPQRSFQLYLGSGELGGGGGRGGGLSTRGPLGGIVGGRSRMGGGGSHDKTREVRGYISATTRQAVERVSTRMGMAIKVGVRGPTRGEKFDMPTTFRADTAGRPQIAFDQGS